MHKNALKTKSAEFWEAEKSMHHQTTLKNTRVEAFLQNSFTRHGTCLERRGRRRRRRRQEEVEVAPSSIVQMIF